MLKKTVFFYGNVIRLVVDSDTALPGGLRERLLLTGAKFKCGKGACGA